MNLQRTLKALGGIGGVVCSGVILPFDCIILHGNVHFSK